MSVSMNSYACSEGFQSGQPDLLALPHITVADWQSCCPEPAAHSSKRAWEAQQAAEITFEM